MKKRLEPFLDLLDVRYLPLLAVIAPQSYTVYAWLLHDGAPFWVAALGGFGYESVYIGAVAWAERGTGWGAARPPAVTALLFSVAVSVAHYAPMVGALAVLHAGFPIVAYAYTVTMHSSQTVSKMAASKTSPKQSAAQRGNALRRQLLRINGGRHTRREWLDLCQRFGFRCVACGEARPLCKDHIVAVRNGGSNSIDNIQPLCKYCNSEKADKVIDYRASALERLSAGDDTATMVTTRREKVAALAAKLGVSQRTVWRKVSAGEIDLGDTACKAERKAA